LKIYDWPFTRAGYNFGTGVSPTAKARLDGSGFRIMPWTVILLVFSILTGLVFGHLFIGLLFGSSSEQSQSLGVVGYIFTSLLSVFMLMYAGLILYRSMMQKRLVQAFVKKQALLAEY
jgi:cytochrome c oxidase subunit IV